MKTKQNIVQQVLSEYCIYGGFLATRMEVCSDLLTLARLRGEKPDHNWIDRLCWMPAKATPDQIEQFSAAGRTLKNMRAMEK